MQFISPLNLFSSSFVPFSFPVIHYFHPSHFPSCMLFLPLAIFAPFIFPRHPFSSSLCSSSIFLCCTCALSAPFISPLKPFSLLSFCAFFCFSVILDFLPPHVIYHLMHSFLPHAFYFLLSTICIFCFSPLTFYFLTSA